MKTSEDIAKSIREIGGDVDEICLRIVGRDYCHIFDRRYADRLVNALYDLNLKSWEIVDVQIKSMSLKSWEIVDVQSESTRPMISQLHIYLKFNCNHQTNIFGDVVEALIDSFWK